MNELNNNDATISNMHANSAKHDKFHEQLSDLVKTYAMPDLSNVWILNELVVPFKPTMYNKKQFIKYAAPLNDFTVYSHHGNASLKTCPAEQNTLSDCYFQFKLAQADAKCSRILQRKHVHTLYACNGRGARSLPLIIFPQNELNADLNGHALSKTACIEQNPNGDLNDLNSLFKWLRMLVQSTSGQPAILLMNDGLHRSLTANSELVLNEFVEFCKSGNIFILFYPTETKSDVFNQKLFARFKDQWSKVLQKVSIIQNPHSQVTFMMIYNQVLRILYQESNLNDLYECFGELFRLYPVRDSDGSDRFDFSRKLLSLNRECSSKNEISPQGATNVMRFKHQCRKKVTLKLLKAYNLNSLFKSQ